MAIPADVPSARHAGTAAATVVTFGLLVCAAIWLSAGAVPAIPWLVLVACIGTVAFVLTAIARPEYGLVAALAVCYNPLFIYHYLVEQFFRGGGTRATLSMGAFALLAVALVLRQPMQGRIPRVKVSFNPLPFVLVAWFVLAATLHGLVAGNDQRVLLYDLFPFAEFFLCFACASVVLADAHRVERFVVAMLIWCIILLASDLLVASAYYISGRHFAYAPVVGNIMVNRIPDLATPLVANIAFGFAAMARNGRIRRLARATVVLAVLVSFASFWRTLLIATVAPPVLWMLARGFARHRSWRRISPAKLLLAVLAVALLNHASTYIGNGNSLLSLVVERTMSAFDTEASHTITARLTNNSDMMASIARRPLIGYGLGASIMGADGVSFFVSDTSNYYLRLFLFFGVVGGLVCAWFAASCVLFVRRGLRRFRTPLAHAMLWSDLLVGAAVALIMMAFPSFVHYPVGAYTAVALALGAAASGVSDRSAGRLE